MLLRKQRAGSNSLCASLAMICHSTWKAEEDFFQALSATTIGKARLELPSEHICLWSAI